MSAVGSFDVAVRKRHFTGLTATQNAFFFEFYQVRHFQFEHISFGVKEVIALRRFETIYLLIQLYLEWLS
jgi:hypothetical protein